MSLLGPMLNSSSQSYRQRFIASLLTYLDEAFVDFSSSVVVSLCSSLRLAPMACGEKERKEGGVSTDIANAC